MTANNKKSILVVDDQDDIRELLRDLLEERGYDVLEAEDGFRAVEQIEQHRVDLVMTDLVMPEKEGIELIRILRVRRPFVKIIALSGVGDSLYLKMARILGAHETIRKPFEPGVVGDMVDRLINV